MGSTVTHTAVHPYPDGYGSRLPWFALQLPHYFLMDSQIDAGGFGCGVLERGDGSGHGLGVCGWVDGGGGVEELRLEPEKGTAEDLDDRTTSAVIPQDSAWTAYHYLRHHGSTLLLRDGREVQPGEVLHEDEVILCQCGLHAGLSPECARTYAPSDAVLTKVKVWGKIVVGWDKLAAEYRQIVQVIRQE